VIKPMLVDERIRGGVAHVWTPTKRSGLGAKSAGEAGTTGAPGAAVTAINDALRPFNARITAQPFAPQPALKALVKV